MDWLLILVVAAAMAIVMRVFQSVRKVRRDQTDNWDAKVIERLRAQGSDPFKPHDVDFFFALPTEGACNAVRTRLEAEGFAVDTRQVPENEEQPYSLHATKSMRLSAETMRELSQQFTQLAHTNAGRYDGWAARVVEIQHAE